MIDYSRRLSVRTKMFLSYLLIFIVPLLIIGISSLYWMTNNIRASTKGSYQSLVSNVQKTIDEQFRQLDDLSVQLSETTWVKTIMFMRGRIIDYDRIPPTSYSDYIQQLQLYKIGNTLIDDIAIYFHDKDLVVSSIGKNNFRWFTEDHLNAENLDYEQWVVLTQGYNEANVYPRMRVDTYGRKRKGLLYIQSLPVSNRENIKGTCICFIKLETLYGLLDPLFIDEGTSAIVLDGNGNIVLSRNASDDLLVAILNENFESQNTVKNEELKLGDNILYVFHNKSSYNGWTYVVSTPKDVIMEGVDRIKLIFVFLVVISSIVGILGSYVLASRNYKPLRNIIELIEKSTDRDVVSYYHNEYLWLENSIYSIIKQEEQLNVRLEEQRPIVTNSYLKKLLEKDLKVDSELLKLLEFLDIEFPYGHVICGVAIGTNLTTTSVKEFVDSILDSTRSKFYLVSENGMHIVIFNFSKENELNNLLKVLKEGLSFVNGNIAIGLGRSYHQIQNISKSYKEAKTAVRYRLIKNGGNIIPFEEIGQTNHCYYYPIDEELQFANCLKAGNYDDAMDLFREILNKNLEQESLSVNSIQFFFINVKFTALKIVEQLDLDSVINIDPNTILNHNKVDDMKMDIEEICSHICDVVNKSKKSNNVDLKEDIRNYIHRYYTDEQLSLSRVADEFSISSPYLSRFFKEQFGCNFTDYVTKLRIDAAKEKLLEQDIEIQIVSREVGYNNDGTFRRLFKKHEGISPSEYRNGFL